MKPIRFLSSRGIAALALVDLLAMADRSIFAAVAPLIGHRYALTNTQLGILLGPAFAVTYAIAAIGCGLLVDRGHARRLILAGLVLEVIAAILLSVSTGFASLLVGRLVLGLGQAALVPTALALMAGATAEHARARALATFTGASVLGRSVGLLMTGGVLWALGIWGYAAQSGGWRVALIGTVLPVLLLAALLGRMLRGIDLTVGSGDAKAVAARPASATVLVALFVAAVSPILIGQSIGAWMPALLTQRLHLAPASAAALLGGIVLIFAPAAQALGGFVTARVALIRAHPFATIGACLMLAEPFLLLAWQSRVSVIVAVGVAGATVFVGVAGFVGLFAVQAAAPASRRGTVTGLFMAVVTLAGAGGGPFVTGVLADQIRGLAAGDRIGAALSLVGAAAAMLAMLAAIVARPWRVAADGR